MKDVKVHLAADLSAGEHVVLQPDYDSLKFDYDAALSKLVAETLRADTAEAKLAKANKSADTYLAAWEKCAEFRDASEDNLKAAEQRVSELEKVLGRIARPHDCGCWPCMGSCVSQEALQITVDEMRERAHAALNPTPKEESHE